MYGSTGSDKDLTGFQTFTYDEIKAAVDVAHHFGKRLAFHSYGPDGARDGVRAGVDSVEHAIDLDDTTLAEMAKRGTFYVLPLTITATMPTHGVNLVLTRS